MQEHDQAQLALRTYHTTFMAMSVLDYIQATIMCYVVTF